MNDICISIWCETESNISISDDLYKYFSSDDLLSLNYISHGKNLISAHKNDGHNIKSIIEYNLNDAYSISQDSSSKLIPNDLHSVAWNELQRDSLQYQQFNNNNNNGPPGLKKPISLKNKIENRPKLKPSQAQQAFEETKKMRPLVTPRKGKQDAMIAKQIERTS